MKKYLLAWLIALGLVIFTFVQFYTAYEEYATYNALTNRSVLVLSSYQTLSQKLTNAIKVDPQFRGSLTNINLVSEKRADSADIMRQLKQLDNYVLDSVNVKISALLSKKLKGQLSWLLKSNVPDSVRINGTNSHLRALSSIDSLLAGGIARTHFLFQYRSQKVEASLDAIKLRIIFFSGLATALMVLTIVGMVVQRELREKSEKRLSDQETKFQALVENSQDLVVMVDKNMKLLYRNAAATAITGFTEEERRKNTNLDEVHPEDRETIRAYLQELNEQPGKIVEVSYRLLHKAGHYVWLEGTFTSRLHDPALQGVIINVRDVTKQKNAEINLIKSERRFRKTLEDMLEGIQIIGFDWKYIYVNDALTKYSTYPKEKMLGHSVMEIYPGVEQTELYKLIQDCFENRHPHQLESEFVFPNGSKRFFELSIQPVDEGVFILSVDITDRKYAADEITKLNRLYAFISAVNQSIVHISDQQKILQTACEIATDTGGFSYAAIHLPSEKLMFDHVSKDVPADDASGLTVLLNAIQPRLSDHVAEEGGHVTVNDLSNDSLWHDTMQQVSGKYCSSFISLALYKSSKQVGTFTLVSSQDNFFDKRETDLLLEAAGDLSFSMEIIEKNKQHLFMEQQLLRNEQRFRALIENSTDLKTLTDQRGQLVYASPSVSKKFGYTLEEYLDKPAFGFFHEEDLLEILEKRAELLDKPGASFEFCSRIRHKDGHWIWCEGTLTNMLHNPAIAAFVSNFRDISERKKAEEQRAFDRNNLNALINNTADLIWSMDRDYRLITCNKPFYDYVLKVSGLKMKRGASLLEVVDIPGNEIKYRKWYDLALGGESFSAINRMDSDRGTYYAEISFYPMHRGDEIIGTACYSRDITARIQEENERIRMIADLQRYSKNLEQFAYVVSHNLRSPVAHIIGLSNLLQHGLTEDDRNTSREHLHRAVIQLDTIVQDLNKILELRSLTGLKKEQIDLDELLQSIKILINDLLEKEEVQITMDFEVRELFSVKSYAHSIFLNLITNSIKYKHPERHPVISIRSFQQEKSVILVFKDNGIGLDLQQHGEKIFGLYQRFHLNVSGKGMGLFMVRTQVEALDGKISLNAVPNVGCEFRIELPLT